MTQTYEEFLQSKELIALPDGKSIDAENISTTLFPFQRDIVRWACYKGRAAVLLDTGLGKTLVSLEWARLMDEVTLIVAPLAVAKQTVKEAEKFGYYVRYIRHSDEVLRADCRIYITNYEMLDHFIVSKFGAVVLDESGILKNLTGKTKQKLVNMFANTPYRLCCSATPAPNDITEIANHAEFLGIMSPFEMKSIFFTYNSNAKERGNGKGSEWRLKKHAVKHFYRWLASWAIACKKPSDIGYEDDGYILPQLHNHLVVTDNDWSPPGMLPGFAEFMTVNAIDAKHIRRDTIEDRVKEAAALVNNSDEQFVIWTALNDEANAMCQAIPDAVNVYGSMSPEEKADLLLKFVQGEFRVLVSKTKIAGFGLNMQNCHNMIFLGMDYSWESYYQAIRRVWRFGQASEVHVWVIVSKQAKQIYESVLRKEEEAEKMTTQLITASAQYSMEELHQKYHSEWKYQTGEQSGDGWQMLLGDSATRMQEIDDDSIDLSIYSPPFSSLFVYSATPHDLGNCASNEEFFEHYGFIIRENLRITKPGRLCCVHIQDTRAFKNLDGYIGRKDLSGDVIDAYQQAGWVFWQRITIDKNPQIQAIRLKAQDLLFATLKRDATKLAGGMADYLLIFKKPGENEVPVLPIDNGEMTEEDWIRLAHPVWTDIKETAVLNVATARADEDEKHLCPLQLPVIENCLKLWSNPGELIFSPFAGIGSEGYEAIQRGRRFIGIELKPEYFEVASRNLTNAEHLTGKTLFEWAAENA